MPASNMSSDISFHATRPNCIGRHHASMTESSITEAYFCSGQNLEYQNVLIS
jgi:hypothetical protein